MVCLHAHIHRSPVVLYCVQCRRYQKRQPLTTEGTISSLQLAVDLGQSSHELEEHLHETESGIFLFPAIFKQICAWGTYIDRKGRIKQVRSSTHVYTSVNCYKMQLTSPWEHKWHFNFTVTQFNLLELH